MQRITKLCLVLLVEVLAITGYYSNLWWLNNFPEVFKIYWMIVLMPLCMPVFWIAPLMYFFPDPD